MSVADTPNQIPLSSGSLTAPATPTDGALPATTQQPSKPQGPREQLAVAFQIMLHPNNQLLLDRFVSANADIMGRQRRGEEPINLIGTVNNGDGVTATQGGDGSDFNDSLSPERSLSPLNPNSSNLTQKQLKGALRAQLESERYTAIISSFAEKDSGHAHRRSTSNKRIGKASILSLLTPRMVLELVTIVDNSAQQQLSSIVEEEEALQVEMKRLCAYWEDRLQNEDDAYSEDYTDSDDSNSESTALDLSASGSQASDTNSSSSSNRQRYKSAYSVKRLKMYKATPRDQRNKDGFMETYRKQLMETATKRLRVLEDIQVQIVAELGYLEESDFHGQPLRSLSPLNGRSTHQQQHSTSTKSQVSLPPLKSNKSAKDLDQEIEEHDRRKRRDACIRAFTRRADHPCVSLGELVNKVFTYRTVPNDIIGAVRMFFDKLKESNEEMLYVVDEEEPEARKRIARLELETAQELYSSVVRRSLRMVQLRDSIANEKAIRERVDQYSRVGDTARKTQIEVKMLREDGVSKNDAMKEKLINETNLQQSIIAAETQLNSQTLPQQHQLQTSTQIELRKLKDDIQFKYNSVTKKALERQSQHHDGLCDALEQKLAMVGAALAAVAGKRSQEVNLEKYNHQQGVKERLVLVQEHNKLIEDKRLAVLASRHAGDHAHRIEKQSAFLYIDTPHGFRDPTNNAKTSSTHHSASLNSILSPNRASAVPKHLLSSPRPSRSMLNTATNSQYHYSTPSRDISRISTNKQVVGGSDSNDGGRALLSEIAGYSNQSPFELQLAAAIDPNQTSAEVSSPSAKVVPSWILPSLLSQLFTGCGAVDDGVKPVSVKKDSAVTTTHMLLVSKCYPCPKSISSNQTLLDFIQGCIHRESGDASAPSNSRRRRKGSITATLLSEIGNSGLLGYSPPHLSSTTNDGNTTSTREVVVAPSASIELEELCFHLGITLRRPNKTTLCEDDYLGPWCQPAIHISNNNDYSSRQRVPLFTRDDDFIAGGDSYVNCCPFSTDPALYEGTSDILTIIRSLNFVLLAEHLFAHVMYYQTLRRHAGAVLSGRMDVIDQGSYSLTSAMRHLEERGISSSPSVTRRHPSNPYLNGIAISVAEQVASWIRNVIGSTTSPASSRQGNEYSTSPTPPKATSTTLEEEFSTPSELLDEYDFSSFISKVIVEGLLGKKGGGGVVPNHVTPTYVLYRALRHLVVPAWHLDFTTRIISGLEASYCPKRISDGSALSLVPFSGNQNKKERAFGPSVSYPHILLLPTYYWHVHVVDQTDPHQSEAVTTNTLLRPLKEQGMWCGEVTSSGGGRVQLAEQLEQTLMPLLRFWCEATSLMFPTPHTATHINTAVLHFVKCRTSLQMHSASSTHSMPNNVIAAILESSEHPSMRLLAAATRASSLQAMSDALHLHTTLHPTISVSDAAAYLCDTIFPDLHIARHEAQELLLVGLSKGVVPSTNATTHSRHSSSSQIERSPSGAFGASIIDSLMTYHFLQENLVKSTLFLLRGGDGDVTHHEGVHRSQLDLVCDSIEMGFPLFVGVLLSLTESMDDIEEFSTSTTISSSSSTLVIGAACSKQSLIRKLGRPVVTQRLLSGGL